MRPPANERLRRCLERGNKTAPAARGKWAPAPAIVIDAPADIAAELRRRASEGQTASDALHAIGINAGPNATWEQAILRFDELWGELTHVEQHKHSNTDCACADRR